MNIKTHVKDGIIHVKMDDLIDHPPHDFKINAIQPTSFKKIRMKPKIISLKDAHKRMGHTGVQRIENSIKHSHYEENIDLIKEPNEFWCETCKVSKATRRNHYAGSMNEHSIDHEPGSSWCMDIFGPVSNSNSDTKRYMLIMVDNNTRYCITSTHFNKNAETILAQIKKNIQYVETQFDRKVREINSDQGTEFTNDQIAKYFVSKGIHHIFSATQDHAANGRAERYIRTIVTDATTLLKHSNLRIKFWEYAVTSATNVRNCLENKTTGQLPLKAISSQPVKVRFMSFLPFGEQGIIWNHKHNKLEPSGLSAIILCKDPNSHGYKFFVPSIKKIVTSDNYTIPDYAVDPILRNTQNIYLDDQSRSDTFNEAESSDAVSRLYDALENYEDDHKRVTLLTDLFTTEELAQIEVNAKYPSPSDNLEGNLDYVFANIEESEEDEYDHVTNMDIDSDLQLKEKITTESDRNKINKSSTTDEDILDENVYRIPTAIQENLVGSQNTININNDGNIASRMQRKISGNEINYKELSDDESDYSSHHPTTDSVTVTRKNNKTDSVIIESQQERSVEPSVESVHDTVPLEKGSIERNVKFRSPENEVDLKTNDMNLPIKTVERVNNYHTDDYSTNNEDNNDGENHHPTPLENSVDNNNKAGTLNDSNENNSSKEQNEKLVKSEQSSETQESNTTLETSITTTETDDASRAIADKTAFLSKTFGSLNRKRKRHVENNNPAGHKFERDKKRLKKNRVKLVPDNTETSSTPKIRAIYYNEAITKNTDLKEKHEYKQAYHKELHNLIDMEVFDMKIKYNRTEIPDKLIIPTNTIFTKKRNGIYKARIVCRGDIQTPDTYNVIATESLNHNHIKIFLMIANNRNMFMKTLDINHAFLYAKLEEEIYIPHPHDRRCVVKLNKALYGLKQSPKEWNDHLRQYLNSIGLKDNTYTPGLYQSEDKNLMIAVYVDDCVIAADDEQRLDEFINELESNFELKITGTLIDDVLDTDILGMDLVYNKKLGTIDLTLKSFIERMTEKYKKELEKVRKSSIPHTSTYKIDPKKDELQMSDKEFRQGVLKLQQLLGELNYVRYKCRYDIEFAVKKVARLVNYPHEQVFYMIYKIIQYLARHKNIGIHYDRDLDKDKKIIGITDASVGSEYDAQSRIGVIIWYGRNIYNIYSNKSTNRCVSSTEAELHAIYEGYADSETLKATLTELGEGDNRNIVMITDSKPSIQSLNRSYQQPKEKFTWIKTEIIKEKIKEKVIKLLKITGKENIADLLTKPVSISDFERFIKVLKNQITSQDILASTDY
ncbi:uncharacterized protein SKDI_01G0670 [Saccharomyces kudriavzevii IFO 1802]|uniref:Integrase catalytic domain-containing protein n=1 Tax=Saccharomyces kudriavzevii (strain ATCC MYA-4449 / AS 2.2408 / CBS 8840 / NBRC 1802 / NCYC 2889) TaxID=226230 RepID=A0AA35NNS5_SACK1|nr:uncharacterized protein SKDI_01G0670 [Saccharomyces kudriavzevii IFO 1802]CAI4054592.1 hypothetical protein SKDI_01G0670 [Saccharomyces kudriavzevii IFO 1802]